MGIGRAHELSLRLQAMAEKYPYQFLSKNPVI